MTFKLSNAGAVEAKIAEDQSGEYGLYIIPASAEICITEHELRAALREIDDLKLINGPGVGKPLGLLIVGDPPKMLKLVD